MEAGLRMLKSLCETNIFVVSFVIWSSSNTFITMEDLTNWVLNNFLLHECCS